MSPDFLISFSQCFLLHVTHRVLKSSKSIELTERSQFFSLLVCFAFGFLFFVKSYFNKIFIGIFRAISSFRKMTLDYSRFSKNQLKMSPFGKIKYKWLLGAGQKNDIRVNIFILSLLET